MARLRRHLPSPRALGFALTGVLAAVGGMAAGHLVAAVINPAASPVLAVGSAVIDATPTPVKEYAVAQFGTADKPILLATVTLVTLVAAAVAGVLARRRVGLGIGFVLVLTALATAAALTRPVAAPSDAVPGVVAAVVGVAVLLTLRSRLTALRSRLTTFASAAGPSTAGPSAAGPSEAGPSAAGPSEAGPSEAGPSEAGPSEAGPSSGWSAELPTTARPTAHDGRRQFLIGAAAVTVGATGAAVLGQHLATPSGPEQAALPAASDPAGVLPRGLEATVKGVTPLRTTTSAFYRVDTNLTVPRVDADRWTLTIDGMVDRPATLTYQQLTAMPLVERDITMTCVSNEVGGGYVGSARWLGVRLADVLDRAGVRPAADQLLSTAVDGFTIGTPMAVVRDGRDALIAIGMNGQLLPAAHGYPARLVTPGLYGFVGATKWLTMLTATTYTQDTAYWTERGWATDAPIKTSSRIDTPRGLSTTKASKTAIGGVAWAQRRGIATVEVSVDGGPWQKATLGPDVGVDYWRQWYLPWDATPGRHSLSTRATDLAGGTQATARHTPFPNGSSGLHEVVVFVA